MVCKCISKSQKTPTCRTEQKKPVCSSEVVPTLKSVACFSVVWGLLWHTPCHRVGPHLSVLLLHRQLHLCTSKRSLAHSIPIFAEQMAGLGGEQQGSNLNFSSLTTFIVRLALSCNMDLQGVYNFILYFNLHSFILIQTPYFWRKQGYSLL